MIVARCNGAIHALLVVMGIDAVVLGRNVDDVVRAPAGIQFW